MPALFEVIDRFVLRIMRALGALGAIAVLGLMFHVVGDITMRFAFNRPLGGTLEYVSFWWMAGLSLLGFAVAQRTGEHIDVPLIFQRMGPRSQKGMGFLAGILSAVFIGFLIFYSIRMARGQVAAGEYVAGTIVWPMRLVVPVALIFLLLQILVDAVRIIRTPAGTKVSDEGPVLF